MTVESLVVVGASLAGLRAAETARKSGFDGAVTLIGAEPHLPYDRPPLSKACLEPAPDGVPDTTFRTEETLREELGIDLRLGAEATALDPAARIVLAGHREIRYDALVIATGARARALPGTEHLAGVHTLRTVDDAEAVRARLDAGARTVIIGAGFIGSEVASGARKRGLDVTVVEAQPVPLVRAVGSEMGQACARLHQTNGTDLRCGAGVESIEGAGSVERVRLTDGTVLDADLVVVGIGADPGTRWLESSGIGLDNGVVCDQYLAAGAPGVYAAGDVARWINPLFGEPMRLEHWTSAAEQAAQAVKNILDPAAPKAYSTVPYFWSDWYDTRIQFVGVPSADEVVVVSGDVEAGRFVALYRRDDRVVGALALNYQTHIMKYRTMIGKSATWSEALHFAAARNAAELSRAR
ncbi:NAD(P)/FAD-dependent oxidoreductase [Rhodococcus opacus]|uniref:Pyridine nucleotide-disulfide oxidoreductase n=1 Tax=Rhodococcus opacus TaxID=37919 RepID=A0A076EY20_RHOOP|nr:FAD-dependent oxidoreductase [Rhodococcus opacus]AII10825.1 pyridine nucleotide-disulfide oxidoreductase [Rhodococcus opacus]